MNHSRRCGIVHNSGSPDGAHNVYLPLEELRAKVLILDVSARVTLTQIYTNPSDKPTSRAKYYFPVPANAAVCAFEMRTADGRIVTGISRERSLARADYEQAISQGKDAAMLEFVTDDIFTISIGSILAKQNVETKLVFVLSLMNDDNADEVRFQLPMCVGERYGEPPPELASAMAPSSRTRIRITTDIQTSGRIQSITSPLIAVKSPKRSTPPTLLDRHVDVVVSSSARGHFLTAISCSLSTLINSILHDVLRNSNGIREARAQTPLPCS